MTRLSLDIDRASPVPLYFQVAKQLEEQITAGALAPGTKLGNEVQLAAHLGLSRLTLRRAIEELVGKGLLVRKRGVGTQVVLGQVKRPVELTSLYDDLARAGQQPATQVVRRDLAAAPEDAAAALGIAPGSTVLYLERVRSAAGEPLALMHNWLPQRFGRITADDLAARGLYRAAPVGGVTIKVARQHIGARKATAREAALLGTRRGAAVLTMQRTAYDDSGVAVEFASHVYRADRYSFESTVVSH